tara:strand:- start:423 stop:776 length:354 start_codon:yes stop_codon:yes gene_type:complete
MCISLSGYAHEMTPAYFKLKPSYIEDVSVTSMKLFNRRDDVKYYDIEVFTFDWKPIPFASEYKTINIGYNKSKLFDVYIRNNDIDKVVYICTQSKLFKGTNQITLITSRICSKIKDR